MADQLQQNAGAHPAMTPWHASRTAMTQAAYILPYLQPGMRLLDVGCGPGSITIGLAEHLAPGAVDALDIEQRRLDQAAALARENDVQNVQFHLGSAYQLPFPDNMFDVVFEHMVLMHLSEPTVALKEAYRVLKPGGIFGGRDADWGGWLWGLTCTTKWCTITPNLHGTS